MLTAAFFGEEEIGKSLSSGVERAVLPKDEIDAADDAHLAEAEFAKRPAGDFLLDAHARDYGDTFFHFDEALDAFYGRQLDIHSQRDAVTCEELNHAMAVGRFHNVRDKRFFSQRGDVHFAALCQWMARPNNEGENIAVKLHGC